MKCEICGTGEAEEWMILPIKQLDGRSETTACEECGKNSKAYCKKHKRIHEGSNDGTTACLSCVEDVVNLNLPEIGSIIKRISDAVGSSSREIEILNSLGDVAVIRILASKAVRKRKTVRDVVREIEREKSLTPIFD